MIAFIINPVAGILLIERERCLADDRVQIQRFNPVAGILLIESPRCTLDALKLLAWLRRCFNPVAGILLIESGIDIHVPIQYMWFQSRCRDSVN